MANAKIWVFNVEQGSMAYVRAPNGKTLVIDCGKAAKFSPSLYVRQYELIDQERASEFPLTQFVVSHPHDDHIEDIERFANYLRPQFLERRVYDWADVKEESGGDYANLEKYAAFQGSYTRLVPPVDWGLMEVEYFGLTVAEARHLNEAKYINNSSLITVLKIGTFKMVLPGDIERDGWLAALENKDLRDALAGTTIFVTSHHGHSSGYVAEIYESMGKPFFNFSSIHRADESIEPAYSLPEHAMGVIVNGEKRYSLTTRKDGSLLVLVNENCNGNTEKDWVFDVRRLPDNL